MIYYIPYFKKGGEKGGMFVKTIKALQVEIISRRYSLMLEICFQQCINEQASHILGDMLKAVQVILCNLLQSIVD